MNAYLTVITTVLVFTQIIRIAQNTIRLRKERKVFEGQCAELRDMEIRKKDFEMQRKAYKLIVEHFEREQADSKSTLVTNYNNGWSDAIEKVGDVASWNQKGLGGYYSITSEELEAIKNMQAL